jgi:hypothetical protein
MGVLRLLLEERSLLMKEESGVDISQMALLKEFVVPVNMVTATGPHHLSVPPLIMTISVIQRKHPDAGSGP